MPRRTLGRDVGKAREFRKRMSLPEVLLWQLLRRSPDGIAFRKQHPIGPYVLDFYCASRKLAIEIDGIAHDMGDRPERDDIRTAWLEAQGLQVLRIAAKDVLADPVSVADALVKLCAEPLHHSLRERSPSPLVLRESGEDRVPPHFHASANGEGDQPQAGGGGRMTAYSATPLGKKLGYRHAMRVLIDGAPDDIRHAIERSIDERPAWRFTPEPDLEAAHLFVTESAMLEHKLAALRSLIEPAGFIWVSWPKKASKQPTDITEDVIRDIALPLGFVDVKVCAVDDTWSGLKLVIRKTLRAP